MKAYTVDASGVRLFVREWGDHGGRPLVFWDGLGGSGLHANEIAPILTGAYGLRVIAPDAPGHGRSPELPPEGYRPSALAELVADLLSALDLAEVAFVGFSWGAEVGCAFAARYPERTTRLVLIDGGYLDVSDLPDFEPSVDLSTLVARAREEAREEWYPSWDAYFAAESAGVRRWTPALAEAHRSMMREQEGRVVPILEPRVVGAIDYGHYQERTISIHQQLRAAGVPILLLAPTEHARFGIVAHEAIARFQANLPELRVHRMPGDVHDLVSHAAPDVAAIVGSWLSE